MQFEKKGKSTRHQVKITFLHLMSMIHSIASHKVRTKISPNLNQILTEKT